MMGMEGGHRSPKWDSSGTAVVAGSFSALVSMFPGRFTSSGLHSAQARGMTKQRIVGEQGGAKDVLPVRSKGRMYPRRGDPEVIIGGRWGSKGE